MNGWLCVEKSGTLHKFWEETNKKNILLTLKTFFLVKLSLVEIWQIVYIGNFLIIQNSSFAGQSKGLTENKTLLSTLICCT